MAADFAYFGSKVPAIDLPGGLKRIYDVETWRMLADHKVNFPYFDSPLAYIEAEQRHEQLDFVAVSRETVPDVLAHKEQFANVVFVLLSQEPIPTYAWRATLYQLVNAGLQQPAIIRMTLPDEFAYYDDSSYPEYVQIREDAKTQLALASNGSTLLVDGLIDGIWVERADDCRVRTAFGMLQLSPFAHHQNRIHLLSLLWPNAV
jgi:hypothetical protein